MKSLCSTLNFNFFFYLIDRSIELPKTNLNLVRSRDSSYSTYHSGSSSKCFLTTTASKTFLLPSGSKLYSKPLRQAKRSKATPRDLTSLTTHPSPVWRMTHLLHLTSYPLLGVAKTKYKSSKSSDKLLSFLKSHGLYNKTRRPLKSTYRRKNPLRLSHKKIVLFKQFLHLSLPRRSADLPLPFYKSMKLKRQPKFIKSRSSPYLFLNWTRTPWISSNTNINNLWARFKKHHQFRSQPIKPTPMSRRSMRVMTRQYGVKRKMLKDILRKLKRDNGIWSRRLKRLVLSLRRSKTSWIKRLALSRHNLSRNFHKRDLNAYAAPTLRINIANEAHSYRTHASQIVVPKASSSTHIKTTTQKAKCLPRKGRVRTSSTLLTKFNTVYLRSTYHKARLYTPLFVHTRPIPFRVFTRMKPRNPRFSYQTHERRQKFLYHFYRLKHLTSIRRSKRKRSRRMQRFFQKKSWKFFAPKWSNHVSHMKNSFQSFSTTNMPSLTSLSYKHLLSSVKLSSFLRVFADRHSMFSQPTSWDFRFILNAPLPNTFFLSDRLKKPTLWFQPDNSFLFTTSPFFFLHYIISVPKGLSDTSQVLKSTSQSKQFTVFPDSDAIKASVFRYVNRQKSLLQSRRHFYKSFAKRHLYRPTRLLKSNLLTTSASRVRSQNFLFSGLPRSPYWTRLKNLHLLPRRVRNSAINRIRRIRFKPGYGRIWRSARVSVKDILGINTRYQYRLTPILQKQYFQSRNEKIENLSFTFGYALLSAKFAHDTWVLNSLLTNNNAFLNGVACTNKNTRIFQNDFIQLVVNLKFYISLRWLKNWTFKKRSKVAKIFYKKIRPGITRGSTKTPKLSRNLPNYFFDLEYSYSDIPKAFEVDYFSLSLFVVHDQLRFERYLPRKQFRINYSTLNMYNWKYIT